MLKERSVQEQRCHAVMEVLQGAQIIEVAARYGVSRQSVHAWLDRYREDGLAGLATRSSRPGSCPHQTDVEIEQRICELRRAHPRWGPRRLGFELARRGVQQPPSRATVYRILVRNGLLDPKTRRKRRSEYLRWERAVPMELWQTSDRSKGQAGMVSGAPKALSGL